MSRLLTLLLAICVLCGVSVGSTLETERHELPTRDLQWNVVETEHFHIYYTDGLERVAATIADHGERIYGPITSLYQYEPDAPTSVILRDHGDVANGFAAYFQNRIEIWAGNLDFEFRSTHDWIHDVFTHEFTHIVQLGASKKGPNWLPQIYFQYFRLEPENRTDVAEGLPNTLASVAAPTVTIPMWFAEGVAQYQADEVRADWWDPHRDMLLRTAILTDTHISYRQMEGFHDYDGRTAEMVYNHGFSFVRWLAASYGDSVLRLMTADMTSWGTWNFDRALRNATGKRGPEVYNEWIADMRAQYETFVSERGTEDAGELLETEATVGGREQDIPYVERIPEPSPQHRHHALHGLTGTPKCSRCATLRGGPDLRSRGRADFYHAQPTFSPDGSHIAVVSTRGQDYHLPAVVVTKLGTDSTEVAKGSFRASSSVSWFPDGERLVFSRLRNDDKTNWRFNDLVIADLNEENATALTKRWRATYPDVHPDGTRIVFVRNEAGSTNLWIAELDTANLDSTVFRPLTEWTDGTQAFRPRWSPDGSRIAVSISRGAQRYVAIMEVPSRGGNGAATTVATIASEGSDRDPAWSGDGERIVFSSAMDGVFNLYEYTLSTGEIQRLTNVSGGAFMPDIAPDGRIAYSSYETEGYRVRIIAPDHPRTSVDRELFGSNAPVAGTFSEAIAHPVRPVSRVVPEFISPAVMPRVGVYDGKVRLGAYAFAGDLWDSALLLGGLWIAPDNLDYDAFVLAEMGRERLRWPLVLDFYRMVRHTDVDTLIAERLAIDGIRYGLNSLQASFNPRRWMLDWEFRAVYQRYNAEIDQRFWRNEVGLPVGYNYTYYHGAALGMSVGQRAIAPYRTREIAPQGFRWNVRYDRWWNGFFEDFDQNSGMLREEYEWYYYNQVTADGALYLGIPWLHEHTVGVEARAMFIDASVDSFFYEGIGGIIGLRGYTYYQLQGRRTALARMIYRMPVPGLTNIDRKIGPVYFDKVYASVFGESGRVWREEYPNPWAEGIKSDVGIELRADMFMFYGYPSRLAVTYAHALEPQPGTSPRKWYVTLLFGHI